MENEIDAYQRRLLRQTLNIKWPKVITNEELYNSTRCTPWSPKIKSRRLRWIGHMLRLPDNAPVKRALNFIRKPSKNHLPTGAKMPTKS
jgi:ribosomal 50S subunit-associated protein YjgA (DUF615 family)